MANDSGADVKGQANTFKSLEGLFKQVYSGGEAPKRKIVIKRKKK